MIPFVGALLGLGWLAAVMACALWLPRLSVAHAAGHATVRVSR
jgi:hypothetical protein